MKKEVYEFISKHTGDPIIEWRTCAISGEEFAIFQSDKEFYKKISPSFGGKKHLVPFPTLCPEERMRRRLTRRNERHLYERACDYSGKKIISMYNPERSYIVYDQDIWWSDVRDACEYGRVIDWNNLILSQFDNLMKQVPHSSLNVGNNQENSTYTNYSVDNKNTYLSFGPTENDTCMYGKFINTCKQCYDCANIYDCQRCYEGFESRKCYACQYFTNCSNCTDCMMIEYCNDCSNCIACFGLVQKQYYYRNEYIGKEMYEKFKEKLVLLDHIAIEKLEKVFLKVKHQGIHPQYNAPLSENSSGDMLVGCDTCDFCFNLVDQENCKYNWFGKKGTNSYDCVFTDPSGMFYSYEVNSSLSSHCMTVFFCLDCSRAYWCVECHGCQDIFCCVGLRNKQYCIFNKQYSKEEYEELAPRLINKMQKEFLWGEYFPITLSPYAYNETVAQEYYPLEEKEVQKYGRLRQDTLSVINIPQDAETIDAKNLPSNITEVDDTILDKVVICSATGRPYRIMKEELAFYRKSGLPLPIVHQDERYKRRMQRKPEKSLWLRECDKTGEEMLSVYPSDSPFKVYSEEAWRQEIYG